MRCDRCVRFSSRLYDVWENPPHSIEQSVCERCYARNRDLTRRHD